MSSQSLNQTRISEWTRFITACSKTDPTYKPKALLAVLENDGLAYLLAVLKELKLSKTESLIEAMREPGTKTGSPKTSDPLPELGEGD